MSRRRQARELVLGCLYAYSMTGEDPDAVFGEQSKRQTYDAATVEYARRIFRDAYGRAEEIDRVIRAQSEHWDFARIGAVEKNILRAAVAELSSCPETPGAVVINEAVELAKSYASERSGAFVNGILDAVYKSTIASSSSDDAETERT